MAVPAAAGISYRVLSHRGRTFLYSANTNRIYPLPPSIAAELDRVGYEPEKLMELEFRYSGACLSIPMLPDPAVSSTETRDALDKKVQQIVLGLTENCNLRCRYCVYSGNYTGIRAHSPERMPWVVARKAIDYLMQHRTDSEFPPGIAFYGGEPFLEFPIIRRCVDYATIRSDGEAKFIITTNGTLLNEQTRTFAIEHNFTLIVSLDGPAIIHNRYRCDLGGQPTFDRIIANLDALKREAPEYFKNHVRFSVVLAPPIDYDLLEQFFTELGVPCVVSPLDLYGIDGDWQQLTNQPNFENLAVAFEKDCRERYIAGSKLWRHFSVGLLGPALRRIQSRFSRPYVAYYRLGQCIPGARKIFISPNGNMYPCEKVEGTDDVLIGHVDTGVDAEAVDRLLTLFTNIVTQQCNGCWLRHMCSACLADIVQGGRIEIGKMNARCTSRREAQGDILGLYAMLIENDTQALDFLIDAFPWG